MIARYGGFPKLGVPFGGPYIKDYSTLVPILGYPILGELPDFVGRYHGTISVTFRLHELCPFRGCG